MTNEVLSESQYAIRAHNIPECLLLIWINYIQYERKILAWHEGNVGADRGYVSICKRCQLYKGIWYQLNIILKHEHKDNTM